jgi:hypothetical protein
MEELKNRTLKIVSDLPKKEKPEIEDNVVVLTYSNGEEEVIPAEAFAFADELPGFLIFWNDNPFFSFGFRNMSLIKSIIVAPRKQYE